jgi:hypothetical protein
LKKKGGLFSLWQQVLKSIRDAITLCQRMKETNLWVDSLCILQDDAKDKDAQIANMHTIYQGVGGRQAFSAVAGCARNPPFK